MFWSGDVITLELYYVLESGDVITLELYYVLESGDVITLELLCFGVVTSLDGIKHGLGQG